MIGVMRHRIRIDGHPADRISGASCIGGVDHVVRVIRHIAPSRER
jgi:hypothetical protein